MIITIDMINGDITEERNAEIRKQSEHAAIDTEYPRSLDLGLQIVEPTREERLPIPEHLAELDVDSFISQMK